MNKKIAISDNEKLIVSRKEVEFEYQQACSLLNDDNADWRLAGELIKDLLEKLFPEIK